jgi:hypothetical protein
MYGTHGPHCGTDPLGSRCCQLCHEGQPAEEHQVPADVEIVEAEILPAETGVPMCGRGPGVAARLWRERNPAAIEERDRWRTD